MDAHEITSIGQALFRLAVAVVVVWEMRRFGRTPLLAVLVVGFLLANALASLNESRLLGYDVTAAATLDVISVALLGLVLLNARRAARAIELAVDEARYRREEYERARSDFASLVRHRIFNPLTVIRGGAQTLSARPAEPRVQEEIVAAILAAADELERLTEDVTPVGPEERGLRPRPRLRRRRRGGG